MCIDDISRFEFVHLFRLLVHNLILSIWRACTAIATWLFLMATVSSANIAVVVLSLVGRFYVYNKYRRNPRTFTCRVESWFGLIRIIYLTGTTEAAVDKNLRETILLNLNSKLSCKKILGNAKKYCRTIFLFSSAL